MEKESLGSRLVAQGLIPPCVASLRFNMNSGKPLALAEDRPSHPVSQCIGTSDPFCTGGYVECAPDRTVGQVRLTAAVAEICTAQFWVRRDNGRTTWVDIAEIPQG